MADAAQTEKYPDPFRDNYSRTTFGIWLFLLTDFILFGALYATYAVLQDRTFGGPSIQDIVNIPTNLSQSLIFLTSSFMVGVAGVSIHRRNRKNALIFFGITFLLGLSYLGFEIQEFTKLLAEGNSWKRSAFLSSFFTLLGAHGIHVILGLLWMIVLLFPVFFREISPVDIRRLTCFRIYWQFLNILWIFIFSFVYLKGVS